MATLDEMTERTGWQAHSGRAAMTGLRKNGHVIDKRARPVALTDGHSAQDRFSKAAEAAAVFEAPTIVVRLDEIAVVGDASSSAVVILSTNSGQA